MFKFVFVFIVFLLLYVPNIYTKVFYRVRNKKADGKIISVVKASSSEGCLHHYFYKENCKSFNTIEKEEGGEYECQLLSDDQCDVQ